jgi:hypothetical protein
MSRSRTQSRTLLTAELSLAAACCRWPLEVRGEERVRAAAALVGDWDRFEAVVRRNRIVLQVNSALGKAGVALPERVAERLSQSALVAAHRALVMARESLRLQRTFEAAGLHTMVLKGTPLAVLAYGELGVKEAWDIDLLVAPDKVAEAIGLLSRLGYESDFEQLGSDQLRDVVRHSKEAVFYSRQSTITTELHWALVDNRRMLRGVDVHSPAQAVAIAGGWLRTLADEELFAYLCAHGASHNWGRLKWLADLGALVSQHSGAEVEALYRAAERLGAGRSASVALALCRELFGTDHGNGLPRALRHDRMSRALERNVLAGLAHGAGTADSSAYTVPWLRNQVALFLLEPGAGHAIEQARTLWMVPIDRMRFRLPRRLSFLYHVLRLPLWLGRKGGQVLRHIRL